MAVIKTIQEASLTALGDAIRAKTGKNDLLQFPNGMIEAIESIETSSGDEEIEPIVLTGDQAYGCAGQMPAKYIELYGDTITTENIGSTDRMFNNTTLTEIPFDINKSNVSIYPMSYMFNYATRLKKLPKILNAYPENMQKLFYYCWNLREIPEDYMDTWNFNRFYTYGYADMSGMFIGCFSLRKIPSNILKKLYSIATRAYYQFCYNAFTDCYVLDEIKGLAIPPEDVVLTSDIFYTTFDRCYRLKDVVFETNEDGTPKVAQWKGQTINLSSGVGHSGTSALNKILDYNSGITEDKEVTDDTTYQALKDDPDWFTRDVAYARYNHDSAVNTINSLPDTSAYLATAGGTNTIKFYGIAGSATDGGAINTLTEEEIAVAAAKGWTVTLV